MTFSSWAAAFRGKSSAYVEQLKSLAVSTAEETYADNEYEGDANFEVGVRDEKPGFTVFASGDGVSFVEFGTGVLTSVSRPTVEPSYDIYPGSWSYEHNGPFWNKGYWWYKGKIMYGTAPAPGMQAAANALEQQAPMIAERVYK